MISSRSVFYLIELVNSYAAVYYSYFIFFYMKDVYGFGKIENLFLAAIGGLFYTFAAWQGGVFAQRFGYTKSLCIGIFGAIVILALGLFLHSAFLQVIVFTTYTVFLCFTWPALEAIVSEGENIKLSNMVGLYNVTWAGGGAIAYFTAGILLEKLGMQSLFWFPMCLHIIQLVLLVPLARYLNKNEKINSTFISAEVFCAPLPEAKRFLHMAWFAIPLSYVAANTVIPLVPSIAVKLGLSTGAAGILCSIWMFARLGVFAFLWAWTGWHYKFRWLAASFSCMVVCFAGLILTKSIFLLILTQIGFGLSVGLIYYSSLYYSMNASEEKGAHGGLHEAMIGAGLFIGPACGALSIYFIPLAVNASGWSVSGLLLAGFTGLLWMGRFRMKKSL